MSSMLVHVCSDQCMCMYNVRVYVCVERNQIFDEGETYLRMKTESEW